MSCIQATAVKPGIYISQTSRTHGIVRFNSPNHVSSSSKLSLKLSEKEVMSRLESQVLKYHPCSPVLKHQHFTPVSLFGGKGKSDSTNEVSARIFIDPFGFFIFLLSVPFQRRKDC